jgi:hypothetical protein
MGTESDDPYKPWKCKGSHKITIRQVTEDGSCGLCGEEVFFDSSKDEVEQILLEEANAPIEFVIDSRGRRLRLQERECRGCHEIFKTPYLNNPFCGDVCKERYAAEQLDKRPKCKVCGKLIEAPDRRWKYCENPACQKYRRGKLEPPPK